MLVKTLQLAWWIKTKTHRRRSSEFQQQQSGKRVSPKLPASKRCFPETSHFRSITANSESQRGDLFFLVKTMSFREGKRPVGMTTKA